MEANPPKVRTLDEANAVIAVLWAQNAALRARIEDLEARIAAGLVQLVASAIGRPAGDATATVATERAGAGRATGPPGAPAPAGRSRAS